MPEFSEPVVENHHYSKPFLILHFDYRTFKFFILPYKNIFLCGFMNQKIERNIINLIFVIYLHKILAFVSKIKKKLTTIVKNVTHLL